MALKARADEVAAKEDDISAEQERVRQAEAKLHSTKVCTMLSHPVSMRC